jgi:pyruvate,orthophosphate dikinase
MARLPAGCFAIGAGRSDPGATSAREVGAKAFRLMEIDALGLPVPPAVVLGTDLFREYQAGGRRLPDDFPARLARAIEELERLTGRGFGDPRRPLLISVRSGAPVSMPGMMETLLDVGLNDRTVRGLIRTTGNPKIAWDCYRRLVEGWAGVVLGLRGRSWSAAFDQLPAAARDDPRVLDATALRDLTRRLIRDLHGANGGGFPQEPATQAAVACEAVLRSWWSAHAGEYRRLKRIPDELGTAVTLQSMVYGNAGGTSGSGVAFTRDPATGEPELYLDFLFDAQGEDVVSGTRSVGDSDRFRAAFPGLVDELRRAAARLEAHFGDLQDFEFTIENGRLFLLQTRPGKRSPLAALRIAADLVAEGRLAADAALERLAGIDLDAISRDRLDAGAGEPLATAIPASVGIAAGRAVFDPERARALAAREPVILVRANTSTADIPGMAVAAGLLTRHGGRTSHAAVVARYLDKVCLVGCAELTVAADARSATLAGVRLAEGEWLTLDGNLGGVYLGRLPVRSERPDELLAAVESWRRAAAAP